jgi:hypothetical protein
LVGFGGVERARVGNMANTLGGFNALYGCKQRIARMTVDFMDFMDEGRSLTSPWRGDFFQRRGGRAPWTAEIKNLRVDVSVTYTRSVNVNVNTTDAITGGPILVL